MRRSMKIVKNYFLMLKQKAASYHKCLEHQFHMHNMMVEFKNTST